MQHQRSQSLGRLIIGLGIILVGTLILLDNLDLIEAQYLFRYWPVLLIAYGAYRSLTPGAGRGFGLLVLIVGAVLLANKMDLTDINLWELWPVLIILLGLSLILRARGTPRLGSSDASSEDFVSGTAILGGFKRAVTSQDFRGASLTAIMGGCELDLRGSAIKEDQVVIDVFAFWGGVELHVPTTWQIQVEATPILGGVDDKTRSSGEGPLKRVIIRGQAVMGGVEISN